jgi:predicted PurR-regulated permease PerM
MLEGTGFKKVSIILALGILAALSIFILWPIATSIVTGLILAYIFYPVYKKMQKIIKEKNTAAVILILLVLFLIILPLWFLIPFMIKQIFDMYLYIQGADVTGFFTKIFPTLVETEISGDFLISFNRFISSTASKIFASASSFLLDLPNVILRTAVVFFVFFFGMRDAELFSSYVRSLSPFSKPVERDLAQKFKEITSSVIYGYVVVGVLQGILTGIGLFVAGVPQALILTLVAIIASMIPIGGAWLVWIPAVIYLFSSGNIFAAIGLALYGAIFISWIDNIIRPYMVARRTKISTAIVLIGMIGGIIVFGLLGLIIGPLILSYLLLILDAYRNKKFPDLFSEKFE